MGWGVNGSEVLLPNAVAFSSSSSSEEAPCISGCGILKRRVAGVTRSFDRAMTWSSSLSLSSYSSWLLLVVCLLSIFIRDGTPPCTRRRLWEFESC